MGDVGRFPNTKCPTTTQPLSSQPSAVLKGSVCRCSHSESTRVHVSPLHRANGYRRNGCDTATEPMPDEQARCDVDRSREVAMGMSRRTKFGRFPLYVVDDNYRELVSMTLEDRCAVGKAVEFSSGAALLGMSLGREQFSMAAPNARICGLNARALRSLSRTTRLPDHVSASLDPSSLLTSVFLRGALVWLSPHSVDSLLHTHQNAIGRTAPSCSHLDRYAR
jgi:hypothetical protein